MTGQPVCLLSRHGRDAQTFWTLMAATRDALLKAERPDQWDAFRREAEQVEYREDYSELLAIAINYVEIR